MASEPVEESIEAIKANLAEEKTAEEANRLDIFLRQSTNKNYTGFIISVKSQTQLLKKKPR